MLRTRGSFGDLLPSLLLAILLLPACAVEEASVEGEVATDPPQTSAVTVQIPDTEAGAALAAALTEAGRTDRNVFAHTGADW